MAHMWLPSPSPEESWSDASGADEDGEWPVKGIVGEERRLDGTPRYEVRWGNWHRADGSNTTWETENFEKIDLIKRWNRKQKRTRCSLADASVDMEVPWPDDAVHKRLTDQQRQAYDEKLEKKRRAGPTSTANWDREIDTAYRRLQQPERGEENSKLRMRRVNSTSAPAPPASGSTLTTSPSHFSKNSLSPVLSRDSFSGPSKRGRVRLRVDSTPTSTPPRSAAPTSSASTRKVTTTLTSSSAGSSRWLEMARSTLPSVIVSQPTLRGRISSSWNKAAREAMAAAIRICPDISDDDIPRNLRKFKYLEKGYIFSDNDLQATFSVSRGVFTKCDCMTCADTSNCSCRDFSDIYETRGNFSAYSEGLFTFDIPRGVEVIECNKYCECDRHCGNRVVQHPRNIGVEIFDTKRYGWGVRAQADIPRGKALGTYTGMLVRRDEVDNLPEEHQGYLFDLDSTEVRNTELGNLGGKYTVDSYEHGNWTRFVNHSCSPNMAVYCVVYDTIPYVNMPYVAFVASTDIEKGTELTIDYHPYSDENKKGKRSANGGDCRCESTECRGWLRSV